MPGPMRWGCKGCTTYRPNEVTGAVLALAPAVEPVPRVPSEVRREGEVVYMTEPLARPEALPGRPTSSDGRKPTTRSTSP